MDQHSFFKCKFNGSSWGRDCYRRIVNALKMEAKNSPNAPWQISVLVAPSSMNFGFEDSSYMTDGTFWKNQLYLCNRLIILSCFLPLASSKQCLSSWMSTAPAHCSLVTCSRHQSCHPQTGVPCSDTAAAGPHNPDRKTSLPSGWCRCLPPSAAAGPVDLLWRSSSPFLSAHLQDFLI